MKIFNNVADLKLARLAVDQIVKTKGYYTPNDGGGGEYIIVATGTGTDDGGSYHDLALNQAQLITGLVINPAHFGVNNTASDATAIQNIYDYVSDYTVIDAGNLSIRMDSEVTLSNKDGITTKGGDWHWNNQGANMIALVGTLNSPAFIDMSVRGNDVAFLSQGAIGCASGTITKNWTVERCDFKELPFGVYINADTSGLHTNPHVKHCTFTDMPRFANDSSSGSGLGLVFANGGGVIENGKSSHNTFIRCGRHSFYVSDGGNVTSSFDTFIEHRNDGGSIVTELAALQVTRNVNNVNIVCPVFKESRDLSLSVQAVQTSGSPTYGKGVSIVSPKFIDGYATDLKIGNDSPSVNGYIDDVTVTDIYIKQSGTNQANRVQLFSGRRVKISGVNVESDNSIGANDLVGIVVIFDNATVSEFDDIVVEDVKGDVTGTISRGVTVGDGILTGTHKVTIEDINIGTTEIFQGAVVTPSNPNYLKIKNNKPVIFSAFTGSFTDATSEINTVDKYAGKKIFSLSGGLVKPLYASGQNSTDTWVDGAGTTIHTPV